MGQHQGPTLLRPRAHPSPTALLPHRRSSHPRRSASVDSAQVHGTVPPIGKLSDSALGDGLYVLHLLKAVAPRAVDLGHATAGKTAAERKLNARLAVSCARKAGCMVFLLWEDIVECKPKMLLVFVATLMSYAVNREVSKRASNKSVSGEASPTKAT